MIRGLGGYRVQTLQDGLASLDVAGLSQDHAVTVESVVSQQIEVIKGPAALLYGSGAAGGLVNVVTNRVPMERAEEPISGAVELRGDTAVEERTGAVGLDGGPACSPSMPITSIARPMTWRSPISRSPTHCAGR